MTWSGSYGFEPEVGIEPGEVCGRGRCRGRMITERPPCPCMGEALQAEREAGEEPSPTFLCTCGYIVVCNQCGEGPYD
jgi:hypothetical protein